MCAFRLGQRSCQINEDSLFRGHLKIKLLEASKERKLATYLFIPSSLWVPQDALFSEQHVFQQLFRESA